MQARHWYLATSEAQWSAPLALTLGGLQSTLCNSQTKLLGNLVHYLHQYSVRYFPQYSVQYLPQYSAKAIG